MIISKIYIQVEDRIFVEKGSCLTSTAGAQNSHSHAFSHKLKRKYSVLGAAQSHRVVTGTRLQKSVLLDLWNRIVSSDLSDVSRMRRRRSTTCFDSPPPAGAAIASPRPWSNPSAVFVSSPAAMPIHKSTTVSVLAVAILLTWRAAGTCPECGISDRQQAARLKLEAIKQQILSKLQMQDKPNITLPRMVALEALKQVRGDLPGEQEEGPTQGDDLGGKDDYYARTSEIIAFAEPGRSLNGHVLLDFHPSHEHLTSKLRVTAAKLWIQLRYHPSLPEKHRARLRGLTLYVFRVGNSTEQLYHLTSYRQDNVKAGWKGLEVGQAVQQWFSAGDNREKLTLLVDCVGCDSKLEMVLFHEDPSTYSNNITATTTARRIRHHGGHEQQLLGLRPFLAIATETAEPRRSRRHSRTCGNRLSYCCRQNLYVSFEELGWSDWIIAPKGYYANFCMGNCNGVRTPDTFHSLHTHVIEEYRSRNPYASIHPCCAPTRLSPMSLIYFDPDHNIIKTDLPKMIVEDCGCT